MSSNRRKNKLQNKLFALPERKNTMPLTLYKKLSPDNPRAKISFFNVLALIYEGKLAETIRERKLAQIRKNSTWLAVLELLERSGLYQGMHFREIGEELGTSSENAKQACLRAELEVYEIYGIHIGFFDRDGTWRLGTDVDVAIKYRDNMKAIVAFASRTAIYVEHAATHGKNMGQLQAPLFELPKGLSDDASQA